MRYEIQSRSDFQVGATLTVRIPEADLDRKALYTIQNDCPGFLLPIRYRYIDEEVELTYQVGSYSKIAYLPGKRSLPEYADMWFGLLQPLLDCGDWFMRPESFVLLPDFLYCDKSVHAIRFVYIPSVHPCSDQLALKSMVMEVAKMNHVADVALENKVVWAIQEFNIHSFLQLIRENKGAASVCAPNMGRNVTPVQDSTISPVQRIVPTAAEQPAISPREPVQAAPVQREWSSGKDDIQIQFPPKGTAEKDARKNGLFGSKSSKEEKPKNRRGLFGRKKEPQGIVGGAVAQPFQSQQYAPSSMPLSAVDDAGDDVTVVDQPEVKGARLRYVGTGGHPQYIEVSASVGAIFTIGRFDESVGVRQSDFEFPKKTKAVSRRHAAVEHRADGYYIVDLNSSAGTFLNGQKMPSNAPFLLANGCRVSFGFSGADYVWENPDF